MANGMLQRPSVTGAGVLLAALCGLLPAGRAFGTEYFVSKRGDDARTGRSADQAFGTIARALGALQAGDTLTIGPGEYHENVSLRDFGDPGKETRIRAKWPGTVVLRGDRDANLRFARVPGRRFVYAAECKTPPLSVHEADTLTNLAPAADASALEFAPGRYFHDPVAKKLYVSSSDYQPPERHWYTLGLLRGSGVHLVRCRRVVLDGLAASAYRTPVGKRTLLLPTSGFLLHQTRRCVVRRCTAYFNGSGITVNSGVGSRTDQPGAGAGNLVEGCCAYANRLDGIVAYNPNGETIRACRSFLNQTYGARFYGGRTGEAPCVMQDVIAWGNPGGDFWAKGRGLSGFFKDVRGEGCVAMGSCLIGNFQHGLIGGSTRAGDRPTTGQLPHEHAAFHKLLDTNFADPLNMDFRPQATSRLAKSAPSGEHIGPHPYKPNVYYVSPQGSDASDGLSMASAWKTAARAAARLKPGDTLYLAPGRYEGDLTVTAHNVRLRGRGLKPAIVAGGLRLKGCRRVSVERLQITGAVEASGGEDVTLAHCVLAGPSARADGVQGLDLHHNLLVCPLRLTRCGGVSLTANLYAATPAVSVDTRDAIRYSSYNSYPKAAHCWHVAGRPMALDALRPQSDRYSIVAAADLDKAGSTVRLRNAWQFAGRGPLSTAIGPYRPWRPRNLAFVGPFVRPQGDRSVDIEWWSSLPVEAELRWGPTPECANRTKVFQNAFYASSLTGLQPGRKYYVQVVAKTVSSRADPARQCRVAGTETKCVAFTPGGAARPPATYHVAPDGDDAADGRTRATAWRSLQTAADRVRAGDTVLLAGGTYGGTFYFRRTGEPDRPITIKAAPGERVLISGLRETLKAGFVLYGKHHYRLDSLYFIGYAGIEDNVGGKEGGAVFARECRDLRITRCHFSGGWGRCLVPHHCPNLVVRNCVFMHSMEAVMVYHCPNLVMENNVFLAPLITHLHVYNHAAEPAVVRRCLFGENTRHKVHIPFVSVGGTMADNCFYIRWRESDRVLFAGKSLDEHHAAGQHTTSLAANPYMPGALGFRQGWQQITNAAKRKDPYEPIEFDRLFATRPEIVLRGIGLQPEAFRDFHFWKGWPYDKKWAARVQAGLAAAEKLRQAGKNAQAAVAFPKLADSHPMSDRLKADVLDRAAQCAAHAKDYRRGMELAKRIPLTPLSVRRQMAILVAQERFAELIERFSTRAMGGATPHLSWICPETEDVLADALYYRGLAYARTGDLTAAEADMRTMIDKGRRLAYSPGPSVLDLAWKRLGDFYRDEMKDDAKALEAYRHVLSRKTEDHTGRDRAKPPSSGTSDVLAAAVQSACRILRRQGKPAEALRSETALQQARAAAKNAAEN